MALEEKKLAFKKHEIQMMSFENYSAWFVQHITIEHSFLIAANITNFVLYILLLLYR